MSAPNRWRAKLDTTARMLEELAPKLIGQRIEKVWRPSKHLVSLKVQGVSQRLLLDVSPNHPHLRLAATWPENPHNPDRETLILRRFLTNGRCQAVALADERRISISVVSRGETVELSLQLAGRFPNLALFSESGEELMRLIPSRPGQDPDSPPMSAGHDGWTDGSGPLLGGFNTFMEKFIRDHQLAQELREVTRETRALYKRAKRGLDALNTESERAGKAEEYRQHGELLKTVLHKVKRGMDAIVATDWSTGEAVETTVPLDSLLTPKENLERFFKRYRKFAGAQAGIAARLRSQHEREKNLGALLETLVSANEDSAELSQEALNDWKAKLRGLGGTASKGTSTSKRPKESQHALPYREFRALDGGVIWLGRSAKHNDKMTLQHARGHDVWLHARDCAGSHVILRCTRGQEPTSDALLDAAMLAAWHSKLRGESVIDVMWTQRKNVRKAKGAAAGSVTVSDSKTISVRDDANRLRRIYGTELRE